MQTCPNCGEKTIKNMTKASLGPSSETKCSACHAVLTVPKNSFWLIVVYVVLVLLTRMAVDNFLRDIVLVGGFFIFAWIHVKYIPLIKK